MNVGFCLSDPHPDDVNDGSMIRTISAAHFAGRYRLVDFMLSNMVNSGIHSIGLVLNSQYQTLVTHIGIGKEWDLARKSGGVTFFPPYLTDERPNINNDHDGSLKRAVRFAAAFKTEHMVLTECSTIYNMDYNAALEAHKKSGADITAIYAKKHVSLHEQKNAIIYSIDEDGRINTINRSAYSSDPQNVSLNTFIMRKTVFLQLLSGETSCGMMRFTCDILASVLNRFKVAAYEFKGYSAQIISLETFFQYNMEMLDKTNRENLFNYEGRKIFTTVRDSLPTRYGKNAKISNSIIADGCQIDGTVENCIVFRHAEIKEGAVVRNSIIQEKTLVEAKAQLDWIITDRSVTVSKNRKLMGYRTHPVYIPNEKIV